MCCIYSDTLNDIPNTVTEKTMKKLTITLIALATTTLAFTSSAQAAPMSSHMENALVKVCQSALSNNVNHLNNTAKAFNLDHKTVALKVVCNGDNIITFAEKNGANKTAAKLEKSIGHVNILEIAATEKSEVTFTL